MDERKGKIAAVIVTYNRKELLINCLEKLLQQTRPLDSIIIIDNASTDGTREYLEENLFFNNPKIDYIKLIENIGGAGGFYEGIKRGYERGFNWVWLMDDDGFPEAITLELFCSLNVNQNSCYCPIVLDPLDKNQLTFGFCGLLNNKSIYFQSMNDVNSFIGSYRTKIISGYGNFFNGIFLSKEIIKSIGFPRKEMFIWGDENEYLFRILANGFNVWIMLDNVFYHPRFPQTTITFLGKKISYIDNPATWKYYYQTRNLLYINKKYRSQLKVRWPILKCLLSRLILATRVKRIRKVILLGLFDQILGLSYKTLNQLKK